MGLRGAVSILLAILPLMHALPQAQAMFNATFVVVLVSLVLQGWSLRSAARRLDLLAAPRHGPLERFELELPGAVHHELAVYHIAKGSPVARGARLPRWARPALVVRDGRRSDLHAAGRLQAGDYVYIFTTRRQVSLLDRLFASPTELNINDRELFGDFVLSAVSAGRYWPQLRLRAAAGRPGTERARPVDVGVRRGRRHWRSAGFGPIELVVRTLGDDGRIETVGLRLVRAGLERGEPGGPRALHRLVAALRGDPRPSRR